jgi:nucleoside-diphosphate-sugar epimerase
MFPTPTVRFVCLQFGNKSLLSIDPSIQWWLDAATRLKTSNLEYTRVIPGFFMDYWGMPHVQTHLQPFSFGIDISSATAAIPGDGNNVICMTYTYDVATYLVKALDLKEWPEFSVIVGDEVTYNQILSMAEEFTGKDAVHLISNIYSANNF